jgi:hypothetical protein
MKTLADFKRALTIGSKWDTYHDLDKTSLGLGVVCKTQSNGVYLKRNINGVIKDCFLDFPKADLFKVNSDDSVSIFWPANESWDLPRRKVLTYKKVEA